MKSGMGCDSFSGLVFFAKKASAHGVVDEPRFSRAWEYGLFHNGFCSPTLKVWNVESESGAGGCHPNSEVFEPCWRVEPPSRRGTGGTGPGKSQRSRGNGDGDAGGSGQKPRRSR